MLLKSWQAPEFMFTHSVEYEMKYNAYAFEALQRWGVFRVKFERDCEVNTPRFIPFDN